MQRIPAGSRLVGSAASRPMDTKPGNEAVPEWLVVPDQHGFPKRDPNVLHHQEAAEKVSQPYVGLARTLGVLLNLRYGPGMLTEPVEEL